MCHRHDEKPLLNYGWKHVWFDYDKNSMQIKECTKGPFAIPKMVCSFPFVSCCQEENASPLIIQTGIPESLAEVLYVDNSFVKNCLRRDLGQKENVNISRSLKNDYHLYLGQGIPDPWVSCEHVLDESVSENQKTDNKAPQNKSNNGAHLSQICFLCDKTELSKDSNNTEKTVSMLRNNKIITCHCKKCHFIILKPPTNCKSTQAMQSWISKHSHLKEGRDKEGTNTKGNFDSNLIFSSSGYDNENISKSKLGVSNKSSLHVGTSNGRMNTETKTYNLDESTGENYRQKSSKRMLTEHFKDEEENICTCNDLKTFCRNENESKVLKTSERAKPIKKFTISKQTQVEKHDSNPKTFHVGNVDTERQDSQTNLQKSKRKSKCFPYNLCSCKTCPPNCRNPTPSCPYLPKSNIQSSTIMCPYSKGNLCAHSACEHNSHEKIEKDKGTETFSRKDTKYDLKIERTKTNPLLRDSSKTFTNKEQLKTKNSFTRPLYNNPDSCSYTWNHSNNLTDVNLKGAYFPFKTSKDNMTYHCIPLDLIQKSNFYRPKVPYQASNLSKIYMPLNYKLFSRETNLNLKSSHDGETTSNIPLKNYGLNTRKHPTASCMLFMDENMHESKKETAIRKKLFKEKKLGSEESTICGLSSNKSSLSRKKRKRFIAKKLQRKSSTDKKTEDVGSTTTSVMTDKLCTRNKFQMKRDASWEFRTSNKAVSPYNSQATFYMATKNCRGNNALP